MSPLAAYVSADFLVVVDLKVAGEGPLGKSSSPSDQHLSLGGPQLDLVRKRRA